MAAVLLAYANGGQLQESVRGRGWVDVDLDDFYLSEEYEYRIKPEPREFWLDPDDYEVWLDQDTPPVPHAIKVREVLE